MRFALALLAALGAALCHAAGPNAVSDPVQWMEKIYSAGQNLSYSGVIVYQAGERSETSRILHVSEDGHELEKLETLEGSPREIIRTRDQVKCYLPQQRTLIVDHAGSGRGFPARLVASYAALAEHYRIRLGESGRIAGLDAQQILLEPKDDMRFGHVLWADSRTGLLLKARMQDQAGDVVEQFRFAEVRVGDKISREAFISQFEGAEGWRVINARGTDIAASGMAWSVGQPIPGFELISSVERELGKAHGKVVHMIFSDGLASISVFIEPMPAAREVSVGAERSGPVSIFKRRVGDHLVTTLGEAPARAVRVLAEAVTAEAK